MTDKGSCFGLLMVVQWGIAPSCSQWVLVSCNPFINGMLGSIVVVSRGLVSALS